MDLSKILNATTTISASESEFASSLVLPPWFVPPSPPRRATLPPSKHSFAVILHHWEKAVISSPYHQGESSGRVSVNVATSPTVITPEQSLGASTSTSSDRHKPEPEPEPSNNVKSKGSPRKEAPTLSEGRSQIASNNQLVELELGMGMDIGNTTMHLTESGTSLQRPVQVPGLQQEAPLVATADHSVVPPSITDKRRQMRQKPYPPRKSVRLASNNQLVKVELELELDVKNVAGNTTVHLTESGTTLQRGPVQVPGFKLQREAPLVQVATADQGDDSVVSLPSITDETLKATRESARLRIKRERTDDPMVSPSITDERPRKSARLQKKRERNR